MNLHNFSSFFEMFCAFNLAFAWKETFGYGLQNSISNFDKRMEEVKNKIQVTKDIIVVTFSTLGNDPQMHKRATKISDDFNKYSDKLIERKNEYAKFVVGFQAMFLLSGLFCLYVLLMEGFHQFYESEDNHLIIPICLFLINGLLFVNLIIFFRSFWKSCSKKISHGKIISILLAGVALGIIGYRFNILNLKNRDELLLGRWNITLAVIMAISPFLLHIVRTLVYDGVYRFRLFLISTEADDELMDINKRVSDNYDEWLRSKDFFLLSIIRSLRKAGHEIKKILIQLLMACDRFFW
jgi:hypothetical protein